MSRLFDRVSKFFESAFRVDSPSNNPYPETVAECLDDTLTYRDGTEGAIKAFHSSRPYRGTPAERQWKFRTLNAALAKVHKIPEPVLVFVDRFPVGPCCFPDSRPAVVVMELTGDGGYSVVAYLHEFAHCLGLNEKGACSWSLNLFKRFWPTSFSKLDQEGHMLYKKREVKC